MQLYFLLLSYKGEGGYLACTYPTSFLPLSYLSDSHLSYPPLFLSSFPPTPIHGVDIRIQQRNGRKTLTTIQGLPEDLDQKRILKAFKKEFACNGSIVEDEEHGEVIQLQGDQRTKVVSFLVEEDITTKGMIKVHGF